MHGIRALMMSLIYNYIILALNILSSDPPRFHWLLFLPEAQYANADVYGLPKKWSYDTSGFTLATSRSVAAAAIIGRLKDETLNELSALIAQIPMSVPEAREAIRRMHTNDYIYCPDVDAMEAEMIDYCRVIAVAVKDKTFEIATFMKAVNSRTL
ncbi:hypothetical protein OBBRIDRAFT_814874 [Obba rivulosa]|uniref:Uncharacterized protein n=1 Tax=Obba rivulosa TaxID=1052685 RepID=A0A8E2AJS3_9APHY|nr:hypothetical protein OBBRIDRAFT_814874 [Obba rivulosa]